ncbi:MAG: SPOR domain-containing protein, partial [Desulfuromonadales bacterium]|nr:SPOR domain-containing protein [Desulfuromonadales bacterium]NIS42390.1 SPOR domain-containing protein [Desulfuromonadales bacterium]
DMTRLKVGTYPVSEAAARKAELKPIAPGVFGIRKGDMETVYAGSFLVLDKARRYADKLYVKGIKVEEVPTQVEQTLQRITFGSFATSGTASDAGRQAAAEGLEAEVTKKR